jgi:hypothetical protein
MTEQNTPTNQMLNQAVGEVVVDNGRKLRLYDNMFDMSYRSKLYQYMRGSLFMIGWADSSSPEKRGYQFLHSVHSEEDLKSVEFIERLQQTPVGQELVGYSVAKAIVNLSTPSDVNFVHTHPEDKVILYYVNLDWNDGWHGETLFFDEASKNIMFASAYTPGRFIVFDAKIPHTIRPQSHIATFYRLTFALVLTKNPE